MMTAPQNPPGPDRGTEQARIRPPTTTLADRVAEATLAHPCVLRLHGGESGVVASYLPGRRLLGVRAESDAPVEVCVVLRPNRPLPEVIDELRDRIRAVTGDVAIDVTVGDIVTAAEHTEDMEETDDGDVR